MTGSDPECGGPCYNALVCALCGALTTNHWAESGSGRRARILRARLLDRVLAHYGLRLDDWAGAYVVRDAKGAAEVVADLGALWPVAERLAGRRLDPLDPKLLETLGG